MDSRRLPDGLKIKRALPEDDEAVRALLARCFPDNPKARPEVHRWQYRSSPYGEALSVVGELEGRIVAHCVGIPIPLVVDGRSVPGMLGSDGSVDPALRNRGLAEAVLRHRASEASAVGMAVTLSFPSAPIPTRTVVGGGGGPPVRMRFFARPLPRWSRTRTALDASARPAPTSGADEVAETDHVPPELDELWQALRPRQGCTLERDRSWWSWRFAAHPQRPYRFLAARRAGQLVGALAWRRRQDAGHCYALVMDLLARDQRTARRMIGALHRLESREGATRAIVALAHPSERSRDWMLSGLAPVPRRIEPRPQYFSVTPLARSDLAGRAWSISWDSLDHL